MTRENRAERGVCPECETSPILRGNGDAFCDLCNKYMDHTVLVS